jgi:hypothetical protein
MLDESSRRHWFLCTECAVIVRTKPMTGQECEAWDPSPFCKSKDHGAFFFLGDVRIKGKKPTRVYAEEE